MRELKAIPGIESAAAAFILPFNDSRVFAGPITFSDNGEQQLVLYNWNAVTPDYFDAMGISILKHAFV